MLRKYGVNRLSVKQQEIKRKITTFVAGQLAHIDSHYLPKDIIKGCISRLYVIGILDDYSRVCWLKLTDSLKALEVMFTADDILKLIKSRYGIEFKKMMSDNGPEFTASQEGASTINHPFQRMLERYSIKHVRIKPYRPQTNGKIERFWKTLSDDLIHGAQFESIEKLEEALCGFSIFYNEYRPHQGIQNIPANKLECTI